MLCPVPSPWSERASWECPSGFTSAPAHHETCTTALGHLSGGQSHTLPRPRAPAGRHLGTPAGAPCQQKQPMPLWMSRTAETLPRFCQAECRRQNHKCFLQAGSSGHLQKVPSTSLARTLLLMSPLPQRGEPRTHPKVAPEHSLAGAQALHSWHSTKVKENLANLPDERAWK